MKRVGEIKSRLIHQLALIAAGICLFGSSASAGTYKHITIDGSFGDWAGVPLAHTQEQVVFSGVAYKDVDRGDLTKALHFLLTPTRSDGALLLMAIR